MLREDEVYLDENHAELKALLASPLDGVSPCPWLTQEECTVQILDNIITLTEEGRKKSRG